jgi:hypothetical protein
MVEQNLAWIAGHRCHLEWAIPDGGPTPEMLITYR